MTERYANLATSTLASGINDSVLTLTVTNATSFPNDGNFRIIVGNEIMIVTGVSGNEFTVIRSEEGTSAASHNAGTIVAHVLTAGGLLQGIAENGGTGSGNGQSGYSGLSGFSGYSGSGQSGASGISGLSGLSGYSGSGQSGASGMSGYSGYSGIGQSGASGMSGLSGFSGYSGIGQSGVAGLSGFSGYSGEAGNGGGIAVVQSDPESPTEGQVWYNSTEHELRFRTVIGNSEVTVKVVGALISLPS